MTHNLFNNRVHYTCITVSAAVLTTSISAFADTPQEQQQQEFEIAGLYVDLMKDMPKSAELLNAPYPQAFTAYGTKAKLDHKSVIKGGKALRIQVSRGGKKSYSKGANNPTIGEIKSGDTLCLTFWARSINSPEDNLIAEIASLGVQQSEEPYRKVMTETARLSYDWSQYAFKSKSTLDMEAGKAEIYFHFGHLKQRFEIGPTYLFNLGPDVAEDFKSNACGK